MTDTWSGFNRPDSNYLKVPHNFFEAVASIDNMAELKVVLYVMRHTWGFQEYDSHKRIAIDEFIHGRKRKGSGRVDSGTGLSEASVRNGLAKAVAHGYLECEIDDSDKARIAKSYRLKMQDSLPTSKPIQNNQSRTEELRAMPYSEYLQSPEWSKKRTKALRFARFKCQLCNASGNLNVHHRTYERLGCELLTDLTVLCNDCHTTFHYNGDLSK